MHASPVLAAAIAGTTAISGGMGTPVGRGLEVRAQAKNWEKQGVSGVRGIDISLWDHVGQTHLDFKALHDQGVRFVFIKTSDSNRKADKQAAGWFAQDKPAAKAAKIMVGSYQYVTPTSKKAKLTSHALKMAARISDRVGRLGPGDLPAVMDFESASSKLRPAQMTRYALTWLNEVEKRTGRTPILYSYTHFFNTRIKMTPELSRFPLWQAEYRKGAYGPGRLSGWPDGPDFWQFSSQGQLRGLPPTCDLNVFMGEIPKLLKMAGLPASAAQEWDLPGSPIKPAKPKPTPTPTLTPTPSPTPSGSTSPTSSPSGSTSSSPSSGGG